MIILEKFNTLEEKWENHALRYAEKYGIIQYSQKKGIMIWEEKYTSEGKYLHSIDLDTWEHHSIEL
jgi:hypothetical protein